MQKGVLKFLFLVVILQLLVQQVDGAKGFDANGGKIRNFIVVIQFIEETSGCSFFFKIVGQGNESEIDNAAAELYAQASGGIFDLDKTIKWDEIRGKQEELKNKSKADFNALKKQWVLEAQDVYWMQKIWTSYEKIHETIVDEFEKHREDYNKNPLKPAPMSNGDNDLLNFLIETFVDSLQRWNLFNIYPWLTENGLGGIGGIEKHIQKLIKASSSITKQYVEISALGLLQKDLVNLSTSIDNLKGKLGDFSVKLGELKNKLEFAQGSKKMASNAGVQPVLTINPYAALDKTIFPKKTNTIIETLANVKTKLSPNFKAYEYQAADGRKYAISVVWGGVGSLGDLTATKFLDYNYAAIVNAANTILKLYGGVSGAIFNAAGKGALNKECDKFLTSQGYIPIGQAALLNGMSLDIKEIAKYVVFAVGPDCTILPEQENRRNLLTGAYFNSLKIASDANLKYIAFPAISTQIFGFNRGAKIVGTEELLLKDEPKDAWPVAIDACIKYLDESVNTAIEEVRFCFLTQPDADRYCEFLDKRVGVKNITK